MTKKVFFRTDLFPIFYPSSFLKILNTLYCKRASLNRPAHLYFISVHKISTNVFLNMLIFYILYKAPHDTPHPQRPSLHPNNVCFSKEYS